MKKIIGTLLTGILSIVSLQAQETKSLLWKVEGNGIQTSYVFGTFHLIPQEDFILKDKVKKAMDATGVTVLELDMDDPNLTTEMQSLVVLKDGKQLQSFMDEAEYEQLDTYLKEKLGVGMQVFNSMKPLAINSMITTSFMGTQTASYETELIKYTTAQEKEVLGLETVAFQIGVFDALPYDQQIDQIIEFINDPDKTRDLFTEMITTYKEEDVAGLYDFMEEYLAEDPELQKALLDNRNKNWVEKIPEFSATQKVFYAVGAGHLGGDNGLINLLLQEGYSVTPVLE